MSKAFALLCALCLISSYAWFFDEEEDEETTSAETPTPTNTHPKQHHALSTDEGVEEDLNSPAEVTSSNALRLPSGPKEVFDTLERVGLDCWKERDESGNQLLREILICDTAAIDIRCCLGSRIEIHYAKYGRTPEIDMCGKSTEKICSTDSINTIALLSSLCENQFMCHIKPAVIFNGTNLCPGIPKYLIIHYVCAPYSVGDVVPVSYDHQESLLRISSKKLNKTVLIAEAQNDLIGIGIKHGVFEDSVDKGYVKVTTEAAVSVEKESEIKLPIEDNTAITMTNSTTEEPSLVEKAGEKTKEAAKAVSSKIDELQKELFPDSGVGISVPNAITLVSLVLPLIFWNNRH